MSYRIYTYGDMLKVIRKKTLLLAIFVLASCSQVESDQQQNSQIEAPNSSEVATSTPLYSQADGILAADAGGSVAKDYIGGNFQLKHPLDTPDFYCFDLFGFGMNLEPSEIISARTCKNPGWPDTTFRVDYPGQGNIYAIDLDTCVQATSFARGAHIQMRACSGSSLQRFIYADDQTVRLRSEDNTRELCLVVNPTAGVPMDGAGVHLRREIFLYECGRADLKHAQWMISEGSEYSAPLAASQALSVPENSDPVGPGEAIYISACSRCHGSNGEGRADMQSPRLAGFSVAYIEEQFDHFADGRRGASGNERWAEQMVYYMSTMSEKQLASIDEVAAYLANLPEPEIAQTITGNVERGKQIYEGQCGLCHGPAGLGIEALQSPRLAGVNDWYLLKQLEKFQDGRRGAHPDDIFGAQMVPYAKALDDTAMKDVIAYMNELRITK